MPDTLKKQYARNNLSCRAKGAEVMEKEWHIGNWRDEEGQTAILHGN